MYDWYFTPGKENRSRIASPSFWSEQTKLAVFARVRARAIEPNGALWYCPWEIQGCQPGKYRYSTDVPYRNFKHGQAVWWQAHPRARRRGRKPKCVHPVHQRGTNSTNWWVSSQRRSIDKLRAQSQWPFLLHWPCSFAVRFVENWIFCLSLRSPLSSSSEAYAHTGEPEPWFVSHPRSSSSVFPSYITSL